jgi:hypothetical protein
MDRAGGYSFGHFGCARCLCPCEHNPPHGALAQPLHGQQAAAAVVVPWELHWAPVCPCPHYPLHATTAGHYLTRQDRCHGWPADVFPSTPADAHVPVWTAPYHAGNLAQRADREGDEDPGWNMTFEEFRRHRISMTRLSPPQPNTIPLPIPVEAIRVEPPSDDDDDNQLPPAPQHHQGGGDAPQQEDQEDDQPRH